MSIGERLREERERLGMSQPKLAGVVGTTKQTLYAWETGKTAPDGFQFAAMAADGVDVLYVLTGQRTETRTKTALDALGKVAKEMGGAVAEQYQKDISRMARQSKYDELVALLQQCREADLDAVLGIARQLHQARSGVK